MQNEWDRLKRQGQQQSSGPGDMETCTFSFEAPLFEITILPDTENRMVSIFQTALWLIRMLKSPLEPNMSTIKFMFATPKPSLLNKWQPCHSSCSDEKSWSLSLDSHLSPLHTHTRTHTPPTSNPAAHPASWPSKLPDIPNLNSFTNSSPSPTQLVSLLPHLPNRVYWPHSSQMIL